MSNPLSATLARATAVSHELFAQLGGKAPDGTNCLIGGKPYTGVFGTETAVDVPQPGGGYRRRTFLPFSITRATLPAAPAAKSRLTRTDIAPHVTYIIEHIDPHPLRWEMVLVHLGE